MIIHKLEMYNFRQYIDLQEVSFSTDPERNVTVLILSLIHISEPTRRS